MTEYHEPARSYRTLLPLAALLVALFLVDVALGGARAHLLGWLLAAVLVLGVWALIVRAARVTHSLSLTADELRVGDDAVERATIISVRPGVDEGAPVLGWPLGMPAKTGGLTLQLSQGRDVVVPTRFPDRLAGALGVKEGDDVAPEIRVAQPEDLAHVIEIDVRADAVYRVAGYDLPDIRFDEPDLENGKAVFVTGQPPVGYIWLDERDGLAYVEQVAVLPGSMRQGLGAALLERAYEWAREQGYVAMVLTTYADVPWNAPYYARRGWVPVAEPGPDIVAQREKEIAWGLDETGPRIVMRREL